MVSAESFLDAQPVSFVPADDSADAAPYCVSEGVERMASVIREHEPGQVTLFAIGPFTDIACLQRAFPSGYASLKEIFGLVGSSDGKPILEGIAVVDFNFAMDLTALGEFISGEHDMPMTFLMIEVTQQGVLTNETLNQWASSGTKSQRYYGQATRPHAAYWDAIFSDTDGQALFDAHTAFYFLQPDAYVCENDMTATTTVGGYPHTSTSKNALSVMPSDGSRPEPSLQVDESTYTHVGPVHGYTDVASTEGVKLFEEAVAQSIVVGSGTLASG